MGNKKRKFCHKCQKHGDKLVEYIMKLEQGNQDAQLALSKLIEENEILQTRIAVLQKKSGIVQEKAGLIVPKSGIVVP